MQTFRDFEWVIIDDGSTDGTADLVDQWRRKAEFSVRYLCQQNQGKHVAHNRAVVESRGAFVLPFDSDDACVPHALECFKMHWDAIPEHMRESFSGVTALCLDQRGELVGSRFPCDVTDSDPLESYYRYRVTGEKWGFQRTDVLRRFPMPGPEVGRSYIPESLVWWRIARHYKTRYVNDPLRIYVIDPQSLSRPRRARDIAVGAEMQYREELNGNVDYLRYAPTLFLRSAANFVRFSFHLGKSPLDQWRALTNWRGRGLWIAGLAVGFGVYVRDRWRSTRTDAVPVDEQVPRGAS